MYRKTSKDKTNDGKGRNKISALMVSGMIMVGVCGYGLTGCGGKDQLMKEAGGEAALYDQTYEAEEGEAVFIEFDHTLDEYVRLKKNIIPILLIKQFIPGGMRSPLV